jgi:4-carboxymuconolactone decarboxylase
VDPKEVGQQIIRELRGDEFVDKREKSRNSFNSLLRDYSDAVCYGQIWSRDGLTRKQRSMIVIGQLVALNRPDLLRGHLEGALNIGCTVDEIREILFQSAMYCGVPAAVDAFRIAEDVLRERNLID